MKVILLFGQSRFLWILWKLIYSDFASTAKITIVLLYNQYLSLKDWEFVAPTKLICAQSPTLSPITNAYLVYVWESHWKSAQVWYWSYNWISLFAKTATPVLCAKLWRKICLHFAWIEWAVIDSLWEFLTRSIPELAFKLSRQQPLKCLRICGNFFLP